MYNMLGDLNIKANEELYTRTMHYQTQMAKPALDRPQKYQNSGQNVLRW